jgi:hypothetical protein
MESTSWRICGVMLASSLPLFACSDDDIRTVESTCPVAALDVADSCALAFVDRVKAACDDGATRVEWTLHRGYGDLASVESGTRDC